MPTKIIPEDQERNVVDLYRSGSTIREVADNFGCSPSAITTVLKRRGIARRTAAPRVHWDGSPEQADKVVSLYQGGMGIRQTARELRVRQGVIKNVLLEAGIRLKPGGSGNKFFTASLEAEVARAYADGATLLDLAAKYGTSTPTIRRAIKACGGTMRDGGSGVFWTDDRLNKLVELHDLGLTQKAIGEKIGARHDAVSRKLYEIGVIKRTAPRRANHHSWRGGRIKRDGYIYLLPTTGQMELCPPNSSGRIQEHRLVMAESLGRPLLPSETVHHINGDRADNRLENLQLRQGNHGTGVALACHDCGSHNIGPVPLAS